MLPSFHSPAISVCSEEVGLAARTEAQELSSSPSIVLKTTLDSAHHASEAWILQTTANNAPQTYTGRSATYGTDRKAANRGGAAFQSLN